MWWGVARRSGSESDAEGFQAYPSDVGDLDEPSLRRMPCAHLVHSETRPERGAREVVREAGGWRCGRRARHGAASARKFHRSDHSLPSALSLSATKRRLTTCFLPQFEAGAQWIRLTCTLYEDRSDEKQGGI